MLDLEAVGRNLRAARLGLIGQVVDEGGMHVGGDEDHVADGVVLDELEHFGAFRRVAFPAIHAAEPAHVLNRLREHDEFPGDAGLVRRQQIALEVRQLRLAEHRALRLEHRGQRRDDRERVDDLRRRKLRFLLVAEGARVQHEHRGSAAEGIER